MKKCPVCGSDTHIVEYIIEDWLCGDLECKDKGCWWFERAWEKKTRRKK